MKRIFYLFSLIIITTHIKSQCFEIQSILVDACGGALEGQNEMVIFKVGSAPLIATNMSVAWPNNSWLSLTQNAGTAADIAAVNATILGCGFLKEPTASVLPANSKVLLITSSAWIPSAHSFANLSDTLIVLFQTAGNTNGHFANNNGVAGLRTLTITFSSPVGCTDAVTYEKTLLVNQLGNIGAQDGGTVKFTPSGTASYVNYGCQPPFIPLAVDAVPSNNTVCIGSTQNFTATTTVPINSVLWTLGTGATGTFSPTNSLVTTYTPGAGDVGTIKLYCNVKACPSTTVSIRDSVNLTVLQIANPVISATTNTLCSGNSSVLSYSLANAANTGSTSVLWSPSSATTSTLSVNSANVYTVQITNLCGNNTATVSIIAIPNPTVILSNNSPTACAGSNIALSATSNVNDFSWTNPVSTSSSVTISSATTTTGIVSSSNGCGTDSKTYTLIVTPIPTVTLSANSFSLCAGQSATVQANVNTPVTYTWSSGANTNTVSLNTAGIYTVDASNLCGTSSATVNVIVNAVPTLSVSSTPPSICASGQTASLSLSGSAGTYSWSNGDNSTSTTINAPGVYTATVTTPSCGSASSSITIGTSPLPTVSILVPTSTVCAGSSLTFTASSSDANYLWTGGATTQTVSVNTSSIVVTTTNACGSAQASQTITIIPIPTVTLSANSISLCSGQSATVQANVNTPVTYTWSSGANTNTVSLNTAGIYTVDASNLCGTASATVNVTVNAVPTLSVSSTPPSICASGQTASLSLSGSTGTYSWSNGDNSTSTIINAPGVYTATVTTPSCGSASTSITIGTSPLPTVSISVPTSTVCSGSSLTFTASSSDANYLWTGGATTQTVSVNTSSIVVTTTNACGSAQASQTITIIPIPTVTLSANSFSLCAGQSATVQANVNTPVTCTWSSGVNTNTVSLNAAGVYTVDVSNVCGVATATVDVTISALPNIAASATQTLLCSGQTSLLSLTGSVGTILWSNGATTATTSVTNAGVYTGTVATACGTAVSSVTIATQVTPTIAISASAPTICSGQTSTLTASSNVSNYSWSNGSFNNTTVVNTPGIVTVSVSNNCGVATESINITSATLPVLTITPSSTLICPNETATLTVAGGSAPYTWSNSSNTGNIVITNAGTVTVSSTNACGTSTAISVVNETTINANFIANPTSGTVPLVVSFTNNSSGANSFSWNFGNGNSATTQNVNSQTYSAVGVYTVDLTAINGLCTDNYSLIISVFNEEATLVVPNVFTPNGDNSNDVFRVTGKNIIEFNCTIFNRWGLQLYYWDDIRNGWDGTTDNTLVPDGTYFYIINAKDLDNKEIKRQGFLQLFQ